LQIEQLIGFPIRRFRMRCDGPQIVFPSRPPQICIFVRRTQANAWLRATIEWCRLLYNGFL